MPTNLVIQSATPLDAPHLKPLTALARGVSASLVDPHTLRVVGATLSSVISGQVPIADGALKYVGKLGADFSVEVGQAAAQLCAINILSVLQMACDGNLDRVVRCLKVNVFVNATPDYDKQPEVANGASDLFVVVFGEAGKHARAAVGMGSLPRGVAVEVDATFEIQ